MRAAVIDANGHILSRARIATEPERGLIDATKRLATLLRDVAAAVGQRPIEAVGIATAGPVDPVTGTYRHPPNLSGWHGLSMVPGLSKALGLPVVVGHDATVAALAETRFGARRGADDLIYLTLSTGIGAGIVSGGRSITGSTGGAGEAGHVIVRPGGPSCGAGCRGCLEGVASGSAMARAAQEGLAAGRASSLVPGTDAAGVFAAAAAGDALATEIIDGASRASRQGWRGCWLCSTRRRSFWAAGWSASWRHAGMSCSSGRATLRCRGTRVACRSSGPRSGTTPASSAHR